MKISDAKSSAEKIIKYLQDNGIDVAEEQLNIIEKLDVSDLRDVKSLLIQRGYLYYYKGSDSAARFTLTAKGQIFESFAAQENSDEEEKMTHEKIRALTIMNYQTQRIVPWITLFISLTGAVISLLSLLNSMEIKESQRANRNTQVIQDSTRLTK